MNKSFYSFEKTDRALAKSFNSFFSFKLPIHLLRRTAIAPNMLLPETCMITN